MMKKRFFPHFLLGRKRSADLPFFKKNKGFTLMEVLVYIGVLVIVVMAIFSFLAWSIRSSTKAKVMREVSDNARQAMQIMVYEIKGAKNIYFPTSNPTQLSLKTSHYLPEGEKITYIDFYICETQLCLKKESQNPIALTSDRVEVSNLAFVPIITDQMPSVQIELEIDYKNPHNRPEYEVSVNLKSAASLRNY